MEEEGIRGRVEGLIGWKRLEPEGIEVEGWRG